MKIWFWVAQRFQRCDDIPGFIGASAPEAPVLVVSAICCGAILQVGRNSRDVQDPSSPEQNLPQRHMPRPPRETPEEQKRSLWLQFGRYSQLAFALPAATIAGWLLGSALDRWLHTSWISVVGLFLGIAAGLIELLRTVSRDMR